MMCEGLTVDDESIFEAASHQSSVISLLFTPHTNLISRYLATGSASGVVNVYNNHQESLFRTRLSLAPKPPLLRPTAPKPLKELMNLTTTVDSLAFSPDAQV